MNNKLQIFISSTYLDLIEERQGAVEAILKSGNIPAGMELFTAGDKSQWEVIQRWITESDIYMLILGGRYGSTEPDSGISYTELEYDFAVSSGKPFFAVVISDDGLENKIKKDGSSVIEKENQLKLDIFREKVLNKMSSFFTDIKDIKLAVLETVPKLISDYAITGWVRATDIADTKALADEVAKLYTENKELRNQIENQKKKIEKATITKSHDKEFEELRKVLREIKIDIRGIKNKLGDSQKLKDEMPLLSIALTFKDHFMTGIYNKYGMKEIDSFLFFTICPKLQTYDLMINERIPSVQYRRYTVTKKGTQFFAYVEKSIIQNNIKKE